MYQQEFWMLGEHTLADLKDRVRCPVDFNIVGKQQVRHPRLMDWLGRLVGWSIDWLSKNDLVDWLAKDDLVDWLAKDDLVDD